MTALPVSQPEEKDTAHLIGNGLRKRFSSFSVKLQPSLYSASTRDWAFRRSKSMSSIGAIAGGSLRRWWDRGWGWLLSRKPPPSFARDLEINEEEITTSKLGRHSKAGGGATSWRHLFYKVRAELRKLTHSTATLPTTKGFRYNSFDYRQNFDDGQRSPEHIMID